MREAAHGFQRDRVDQPCGTRRRFEDEAVIFARSFCGGEHFLFAAEPASPRGRAAGAIGRGAGQHEEIPLHAFMFQIVDHLAHAAEKGRAVFLAVVELAFGNPVEQFIALAERAAGRDAVPIFVIAHQYAFVAIIGMGEAGHAVGAAGTVKAVGHHPAGLADHCIGKAFGQIEPPGGVGNKGEQTIGAVRAGAACDRHGSVEKAHGLSGADKISSG